MVVSPPSTTKQKKQPPVTIGQLLSHFPNLLVRNNNKHTHDHEISCRLCRVGPDGGSHEHRRVDSSGGKNLLFFFEVSSVQKYCFWRNATTKARYIVSFRSWWFHGYVGGGLIWHSLAGLKAAISVFFVFFCILHVFFPVHKYSGRRWRRSRRGSGKETEKEEKEKVQCGIQRGQLVIPQ